MQVVNTFRLAGRRVFFGPGPRMLLEGIQQSGSVRQGCVATGISYTKALRMLRSIEAETGCAAVHTEKGGTSRGGAVLTDFGVRLLEAYTQAEKEINAHAQMVAQEKFEFLKEFVS